MEVAALLTYDAYVGDFEVISMFYTAISLLYLSTLGVLHHTGIPPVSVMDPIKGSYLLARVYRPF